MDEIPLVPGDVATAPTCANQLRLMIFAILGTLFTVAGLTLATS